MTPEVFVNACVYTYVCVCWRDRENYLFGEETLKKGENMERM